MVVEWLWSRCGVVVEWLWCGCGVGVEWLWSEKNWVKVGTCGPPYSKHCRGRHRTSRSLPPSSSHNHTSQKSLFTQSTAAPHSVSFLQTSHPIGCVRLELRHSGICVHAAHYHRSRQKRITGPEHVPAQHTASVTPHSARATAIIHSYSSA